MDQTHWGLFNFEGHSFFGDQQLLCVQIVGCPKHVDRKTNLWIILIFRGPPFFGVINLRGSKFLGVNYLRLKNIGGSQICF